MKVLFLCRENVGRSQVAEALFNRECRTWDIPHKAISAGTNAKEYEHFGKPLRELVVQVMEEVYLDVSKNVSKQLTPETVKGVNKIIMMADPNLLPDYLSQDKRVIFWQIPDMKDQDLEFHRKVRDQIHTKVKELVAKIA